MGSGTETTDANKLTKRKERQAESLRANLRRRKVHNNAAKAKGKQDE